MDMFDSSRVFVVDAEKALKRVAKGFCRESRALDTVFQGSRNMGFGFFGFQRSSIQPILLKKGHILIVKLFFNDKNGNFYWKGFENCLSVHLLLVTFPRIKDSFDCKISIIAFILPCEYHPFRGQLNRRERCDELLRKWDENELLRKWDGFSDFYLIATKSISSLVQSTF